MGTTENPETDAESAKWEGFKDAFVRPLNVLDNGPRITYLSREVIGPDDVLLFKTEKELSPERLAALTAELDRVGLKDRVLLMHGKDLEMFVIRVEKP